MTDAVAMVNRTMTVMKVLYLELVRGGRTDSDQPFYHNSTVLHLQKNQIKSAEHAFRSCKSN